MTARTSLLVLAGIILAPLTAQESQPQEWDPVAKGLTPAGELYRIKYTVDDDGNLWMFPAPSKGDMSTQRVFEGPGLRGLMRYAQNLGLIGMLNALLCGKRDCVSLADPTAHFRMLRLGDSDLDVRQRLALEATGKTPARWQRARFDQLLAVRAVQQRHLRGAKAELLRLARNEKADVFTRWAAQDAVAQMFPDEALARERRFASAAETLAAVPVGYQIIARIEQDKVPPLWGFSDFARRCGATITLKDIRDAGGTVSAPQLAGGQVLADAGTLVPYELARRVGNFRVARTTVAIRLQGQSLEPLFWLRLDGRFQPDKIKAVLEKEKATVEAVAGQGNEGQHCATLGPVELSFGERFVVLRSTRYPARRPGRHAEKLIKAGFTSDKAIWVHLADGTALSAWLKATVRPDFPAILKATLTASFTRGNGVAVRIDLAKEEIAEAVKKALDEAIRSTCQNERHPEDILVGRFLQRVKTAVDGTAVKLDWSPGQLTFKTMLSILAGEEDAKQPKRH